MSKPNYYETRAKQQFLFGNVTTAGAILITVLFLMNAALVLLADNFLIHPIPCDENGRPVLEDRLPGQVLDMEKVAKGFLVLYRTPEGENKAALATSNTMGRFRLKPDVATISEEPFSYDTATLDFTVENGQITSASRITLLSNARTSGSGIIVLCFFLTAGERMLFQKLRGE